MKIGGLEHIEKAFPAHTLAPLDKSQALAVINDLAQAPVEEADVYIGRAQLANDQLDRTGERFPVKYLERFAETLPGCPLLLGHDKASVPVGRWFAASVARDTNGVTHLVGDFYLDSGSEAVRLLKLGIAKAMSIGFMAGGRACDLCGELMSKEHTCASGHRLNQEYEGRRCTATYAGDLNRVSALEGSLVGVGCQYGAQAIAGKALDLAAAYATSRVIETWDAEENMDLKELETRVKVLEDENAALIAEKSFIDEGKLYRTDLLTEIERKAGILERNIELDKSLLKNADVPTLKAYDDQLGKAINDKFPPATQSRMLGQGADPLPELRQHAAGQPGKKVDPFFMQREG